MRSGDGSTEGEDSDGDLECGAEPEVRDRYRDGAGVSSGEQGPDSVPEEEN